MLCLIRKGAVRSARFVIPRGGAEYAAVGANPLAFRSHTPYSAGDRKAGYRYQISILQAEFSLTQVVDRPVKGRVFFEEVIRENWTSADLARCS
jgi:hypothetical protein